MSESRNSNGRAPDGRWLPGTAPNPKGLAGSTHTARLAACIREKVKAEELRDFLIEVLAGETAHPETGEVTRWSQESRRWAFDLLANRGYGKVPDKVEVTGAEGERLFDPATLQGDALDAYAGLARALAGQPRGGGEAVQGGERGDPPAEPPQVH